MKKISPILISLLILVGLTISILSNSENQTVITPSPSSITNTDDTLSYFIETITAETKTRLPDYDEGGLGRGVDGFTLIKAFPNLYPTDFINVKAYQGEYSIKDAELQYTGNAASNSAVIQREGMETLLNNISQRLGTSSETKEGVDLIMTKIR